MQEIALVLATIVAVGFLGFLTTILTPRLMTTIGLVTLALGLLVGIPTGFWYHVLLSTGSCRFVWRCRANGGGRRLTSILT